MSLFKEVRDSIVKNKENREAGRYNGIPFPFKKLSDYVPVIEKGMSIGLMGGTGTGKSKFSRFLGVYHPFTFSKKTGYKIKIIIFALEDDVIAVYKKLICHYLWELYEIKISIQELNSNAERGALPDFVLDKIDEAEEFFNDFEKDVVLINGVSEPKEIYEILEKHAMKTGKVVPYMVEIDGEKRKQLRYESDYHTMVIIDNFANVDKGDEGSEREAVKTLARKEIREKCCNFFNFSVIQVLQNEFEAERPAFGTNGKVIASKLEPTLASVGDVKTVSRSQHLVLSLFNPSKYDLIRYPLVGEKDADKAYDIEALGNRFRSLRILKNNDGDTGPRVGVLFDAFSETWEELPQPDSNEMKDIYNRINRGGGKFTKSKNVIIYPAEYKEDTLEDAPF